jgi:hypothetical protein
LNPTAVPVFLIKKYVGLGGGVVRNGKWNDSGARWVLGRKVKHEYGGWANWQVKVFGQGNLKR